MGQRVELRSSLVMPVLLFVFAAMFMGIGLVLKMTPALVIFGIFGVLFVLGGIAIMKKRVVVDDTGVTRSGLFGAKHLAWGEIDHYRFWSQDQTMAYAAGAQGGLIGILVAVAVSKAVEASRKKKGTEHARFGMGQLKLVGTTGRTIVVDAHFKDAARGLEAIFLRFHEILRARPSHDYTPFTLGPGSELGHEKKGTIAFADIEKVAAGANRIAVHKQGKRLSWASSRMTKVRNSLFFLEQLAERGLIVTPAAGMFVPAAVLATLRAAAARHAALPAARVVSR